MNDREYPNHVLKWSLPLVVRYKSLFSHRRVVMTVSKYGRLDNKEDRNKSEIDGVLPSHSACFSWPS